MKSTIDLGKYTAHKSPGKFEGETAATEYYWEQMLDGEGEDIYSNEEIGGPEDGPCFATIFRVQADEPEAFGLNHGDIFMVREDSQGFVYGSVHASRDEAEAKFRNWLGL